MLFCYNIIFLRFSAIYPDKQQTKMSLLWTFLGKMCIFFQQHPNQCDSETVGKWPFIWISPWFCINMFIQIITFRLSLKNRFTNYHIKDYVYMFCFKETFIQLWLQKLFSSWFGRRSKLAFFSSFKFGDTEFRDDDNYKCDGRLSQLIWIQINKFLI